MTPEIKHRIGQIRRGEMPEGYNRVRDSIIPSDWKQYCLGELGKNKNGLNFHREDKGIKIRILGVGDFGNLSVLRDLNALSEISMRFMPDDELLLKNGDIVFVRSNGSKELVGRNLLVYPQNEKVSFSGFCIRFRLSSDKITTAEYINLLLDNGVLKQKLQSENQGSNISNLNQSIIDNLQISIPCKGEQQKIVAILTTQDRVIELKEKRLAEKQRQKKYLMQQLLTGKKRLPGFSGQWEIKDFNQVFAFGVTNTFSRECMCEDSTGVKNIHYGDILMRYGEVLKLSEQEIPSLLSDIGAKITTFVEDGDVVIADTAEDLTAGKAVEVQETHGKKVAAGLHTMLCKPIKDCFAPGWLGYYMNSETYHKQLVPYIAGVKVMSISKGNIVKTHILMPPIEEQAAIAEVLSTADREIELLQQDIEQEKQKKKALMQLLLTGIVRVKT